MARWRSGAKALTTVELRNATKRYTDAVIDASLRADGGRQLVLLGPSGSGKSTILRMIAGLVQPDTGFVMFDGQSMEAVLPEQREAVMVFQDHALFPFHTVAENVEYGLKVRKIGAKERSRRVGEALAAVHLDGFEDRWPSDLSGGERQRVALARAIVVEPRLLLLDEPLSSLDPVLRVELQRLICEVQRKFEITSIFVTHDRDEARAVADDIAVVLDGTVQQVGTPMEVFANPNSKEVASFLGEWLEPGS